MMAVIGLVLSLLMAPSHLIQGEGYPLHKQSFVVPLTDADFEHETQATTGGTTGSWLVWFHSPRDETPIAGEVPEPDFWSDHHVVLASLDSTQHYATRRRFNVTKLPAFRFIHKGKYYRLDQPDRKYVFNWDGIKMFCTERFEALEAFDIPKPTTFQDDLVWFLEKAKKEFGGVYLQSLIGFFAFFTSIAILNRLFFEQPKRNHEKLKKN